MTLEAQLKDVILYRYKSINEFAVAAGMPYSTIDSVLKRGIINSGIRTVIQIFSILNLDMESITEGALSRKKSKNENASPIIGEAARHMLDIFNQLNDEGQEKLLDLADDLVASGKYKKRSTNGVDTEKGA